MGIRPSIMTVFGVDNYAGGGLGGDFWEEKVFIPDDEVKKHPFTLGFVKDFCFDRATNEWKQYYDVLYFGIHNYAAPGIAGLKLSHSFESKTFRALSMIYPEFSQSGYKDIPLESQSMQKSRRLGRHKLPSCGNVEFRDEWFYQQAYWEQTPTWAFTTKWLLDSIGIETDVEDYKWMLVWEWS